MLSEKTGLVTSGPFSVVRHPSYWALTAIITGFFFITGVIAVAIIAAIDLAITYFITTMLEDQELVGRFGSQYIEYQLRVPKFFPKLHSRKCYRDRLNTNALHKTCRKCRAKVFYILTPQGHL